nr:unnamed protein product [Digitaria exilis]
MADATLKGSSSWGLPAWEPGISSTTLIAENAERLILYGYASYLFSVLPPPDYFILSPLTSHSRISLPFHQIGSCVRAALEQHDGLHPQNHLTGFLFNHLVASSASVSRLPPNKPLTVGETLVSDDGTFALGFFSPSNSTRNHYYVGIWYNSIRQDNVVWVAICQPCYANHRSIFGDVCPDDRQIQSCSVQY